MKKAIKATSNIALEQSHNGSKQSNRHKDSKLGRVGTQRLHFLELGHEPRTEILHIRDVQRVTEIISGKGLSDKSSGSFVKSTTDAHVGGHLNPRRQTY